tara:strand:- start:778 stop:984 length:207 start_codon:yes stop_codon:yes gene_type:complete
MDIQNKGNGKNRIYPKPLFRPTPEQRKEIAERTKEILEKEKLKLQKPKIPKQWELLIAERHESAKRKQ